MLRQQLIFRPPPAPVFIVLIGKNGKKKKNLVSPTLLLRDLEITFYKLNEFRFTYNAEVLVVSLNLNF